MARSGIGDRVEGTHAVRAALEAGRVRKLIVERRRAEKSEDVAHLVCSENPARVVSGQDILSVSLYDQQGTQR